MLLLSKPPSGYPMNGLVAYFDLMVDNLLLESERFDQTAWAKARSYIAADCAADPTTGAYTVDKLVASGIAGVNLAYQSVAAGVIPTTVPAIGFFDLKAAGNPWVYVRWDNDDVPGGRYVNLSDGSLGTASAGAETTVTTQSLGNDWWRVFLSRATQRTGTLYLVVALAEADNDIAYPAAVGHQGTAAAGGGLDTVVFAAGASATDGIYEGTDTLYLSGTPQTPRTITTYVGATKTATFTPALASGTPDGQTYTTGPGILIARAQLNPGTTARDYVATTDLQSLPSLYGKSPTLQRGTTSGPEASDGSLGLNGWSGVTDDVVVSSALSGIIMAGSFDIPLVGLFNGTAGTIVSLAASGATDQYQRVAYNGSGQIRIGTKAGAGAETFSADLAVSTTAIVALRLRSDGTTLTLTNHATGTSVTLASQSPTGACRLGLGCTAGSTVADIASAITATLGTVHGSMLSTAGWTRAYRALKARAAKKGVTVTP